MGSRSIPKGGTGTVFVTIPNIKNNLYKADPETIDGEEVQYAGFRFSPNYFGRTFVSGSTDYLFRIAMPEGAVDGQTFYYTPKRWYFGDTPESRITKDGLIVYEWHAAAVMYLHYEFGGKFPTGLLTTDANVHEFVPTPTPRPTQRPTQRSGYSGSGSGSGKENSSSYGMSVICLILLFIPLVMLLGNSDDSSSSNSSSSSYSSYTPPVIKADGNGIKTGLTAVEAAVLLGLDADRIFTMILYGLCKKGAVVIKSWEPLDVEIADPLPLYLYEYEEAFIKGLAVEDSRSRSINMECVIGNLVTAVYKKIDGFSLEETKTYYKKICNKAWQQVEYTKTPELKSRWLDEKLGWILLDEGEKEKLSQSFADEELTVPAWWWRLGPDLFSGIGGKDAYDQQRTAAAAAVQQPSVSDQGSALSYANRMNQAADIPEEKSSSPAAPVLPKAMQAEDKNSSPAIPVLPLAMQARAITTKVEDFSRSITDSMKGFTNKNVDDPNKLKMDYESANTKKSTAYKESMRQKSLDAARKAREAREEAERRESARRSSSSDDNDRWSSSSDDNDRWSSSSSCDSCACACACDSCACACAGGGR